jgi:hypothetical protein
MDDSPTMATQAKQNLARAHTAPIGGGRLGIYSALGALTGAVPLPWIPDALARRVRGALVHDIAARHGLSLTQEARDIFAEPSGVEGPRGILRQVGRFVVMKMLARVGPVAFLTPVRDALGTYVLGYLFNRYVEESRADRAVRIDVEEARRVRQAIDRALVHAFTAAPKPDEIATAPEELRDSATQLVDGVLQLVAAVPELLVRRLDAAFDELLPSSTG